MCRAAAALALVLLPVAAAAHEPAPLTRSEVRRLSDDALARRIFGPLARDMVTGLRNGSSGRLFGPEIIWFWTRPRRDWLRPGICVTDRIIVHLEPESGSTSFENPRMRLLGMAFQDYYIVQNRDLATRRTGIDPAEMVGLEAACAALDPRRDSTPADNSWQLMKAFELVTELGDAARAGRAPAPLDCTHMNWNGPPPADQAECLRALAGLSEQAVGWVQDCGEPAVLGGPCIRVMAFDRLIYFVLRQNQEVERIIVRGMEDLSQAG